MTADEIQYYKPQGYELVSDFCREHHIHGGAAIYARSEIASECKQLSYFRNFSAEFTFECSIVCFRALCIICVYRSDAGDFHMFLTRLSRVFAGIMRDRGKFQSVILCGDLNVDSLKDSPNSRALTDVFACFGLSSLIKEPTRIARNANGEVTRTGIDYVVTNLAGESAVSCRNFDPALSDHHAQLFEWVMRSFQTDTPLENRMISYRVYSGINIATFRELLIKEGDFYLHFLDMIVNMCDIDMLFTAFWEHFTWCFLAAFPLITKKVSKIKSFSEKIVFSPALKNMINYSRQLNGIRKIIDDCHIDEQYKMLKKNINKNIIAERKAHFARTIERSKNKAKTTWNLVNNSSVSKKDKKTLVIERDGRLVCDGAVLAGLFGDYFSTVITEKLNQHFQGNLSQNCSVSVERNATTFFFTPVTPSEVIRVIFSMQNGKAPGEDGVPVRLLKECSDVLAEFIALLANEMVSAGQFPSMLKSSILVPVPKKGDPLNISNYRPIALLSVFTKVIEKLISNRIMAFVDSEKILKGCQHGFRRHCSTETATIQLTQYVNDRLDKGETVVGMFFDLSRAFDTLHPGFVSEKLSHLGIRGSMNELLLSYLTARKFKVRVNSALSREYITSIGTPQGSVLGPLIFLLYVTDLSDHIKDGTTFMYADDTTIVVSGVDPDEVCRKIERAVAQFHEWCAKNRLIVNSNKTIYMCFRNRLDTSININIDNSSVGIHFQDSAVFLGTVLDSSFSWQEHVDFLAKKLNSAYYAMNSLKNKFDTKTLLSVYYALFYSRMGYNIVVWGTSTHASRIFIIQKRAIRLIYDLDIRTSCRGAFKSNGILTLACIYLLKILIFIHARKDLFTLQADLHGYYTRNRQHIRTATHFHRYYEKSVEYAGIQLYNLLPDSLKIIKEAEMFKKRLKNLLAEKAFYTVSEYVEGMRVLNGS